MIVIEIALRVLEKTGAPETRLTGDQWFDLMLLAFFAALAIPTAIFLRTEPEV